METNGLRILDKKNRIVSVKLYDILEEIRNGNSFHWSILYLDASGNLGQERSIPAFTEQINKSENGLFINWDDLFLLSKKFYEVVDLLVIGCKNEKLLFRYKDDREMYERCDFVIEMVDSCYWEVFSKDNNLINRLITKFKETKLLKSDFEK